MATNSTNILSALEKVKLQAVLQDVQFVNSNDVTPYKCEKCHHIALYHYITNCQHVLCGKCHGRYHRKHCPVKQCTNKFIDNVTQNLKFEQDLYRLEVFCKFRQNGCDETVTLDGILDHQNGCKFSMENLLPKIWAPPPGHDYVKQLEEEVEKLKIDIKALKEDNMKQNKKLGKNLENTKQNLSKTKDQLRKEIGSGKDEMKQELEILNDRMTAAMSSDQIKIELEKLNEQMVAYIEAKSRQMTVDISFEISNQLNKKMESMSSEIGKKTHKTVQKLEKTLIDKFDLKSFEMKNQLNEKFENEIKDLSKKLDEKDQRLSGAISAVQKKIEKEKMKKKMQRPKESKQMN